MGMPVIGSPYGSLPELIPKMAGHIVNNYQELLTTLQIKQNPFDREEIRKYIEEKFCIRVLTNSYLGYYEKIIRGEELHQDFPTWQLEKEAVELLPF